MSASSFLCDGHAIHVDGFPDQVTGISAKYKQLSLQM